MKTEFSFLLLYIFIILISIINLFADIIQIFSILIYFYLIIYLHFKQVFYERVKFKILIPGLFFTIPFVFIMGADVYLFNKIPFSYDGLYFCVLFALRILFFYIIFEVISTSTSPRLLINELSTLGLKDIGLITGIAFNQLYYMKDVIMDIWYVSSRRFGKGINLEKFSVFLKAVLRQSLIRAEKISFSLYSSGLYTNKDLYSYKKENIYLFIHIFLIIGIFFITGRCL